MKNINLFAISLLVIILSITLNFKRKEGFVDNNIVKQNYVCKIDNKKDGDDENTYIISEMTPEDDTEKSFMNQDLINELNKLYDNNDNFNLIKIFNEMEIEISEKDKWAPKPLNIFTPVYKIKKLEFQTGTGPTKGTNTTVFYNKTATYTGTDTQISYNSNFDYTNGIEFQEFPSIDNISFTNTAEDPDDNTKKIETQHNLNINTIEYELSHFILKPEFVGKIKDIVKVKIGETEYTLTQDGTNENKFNSSVLLKALNFTATQTIGIEDVFNLNPEKAQCWEDQFDETKLQACDANNFLNSNKDICDKYCGKDPWTCGVNIGTGKTGLDFSDITNVGDKSGKIRAVDCRSCHTIVPNHSCNGKITKNNKIKSLKVKTSNKTAELKLNEDLPNLFRHENAKIKIIYKYSFEDLVLQLNVLKTDDITSTETMESKLIKIVSSAANILPKYVEILSRKLSIENKKMNIYVVKLHRNTKNTFEEIKKNIESQSGLSITNILDITTANWFTSQRVEGLGVGMGMLIGAASLIGVVFYLIKKRREKF